MFSDKHTPTCLHTAGGYERLIKHSTGTPSLHIGFIKKNIIWKEETDREREILSRGGKVRDEREEENTRGEAMWGESDGE